MDDFLLAKPIEPADLARIFADTADRATRPARRPERRVLYIDDHPLVVSLVERILADDPDIHLITSADGTIGLHLAATQHPDVILLDLHLPDVPGEALLRRLQADPRPNPSRPWSSAATAPRKPSDGSPGSAPPATSPNRSTPPASAARSPPSAPQPGTGAR